MFAAIVIGAAAAGLRSRRLDPTSATLAAAALAAGAYWLVHTSIDWFWTYPALTAPVFGLLGSAAAPGTFGSSRPRARWGRTAAAVVALIAVVAAVPLYLSERYTRDAYGNWRSDLQRAYADLDRAADLNPFAHEPLQAEAAIAREAGDRERAVRAFREAIERTPDEWASHYLLGQLLERDDPDRAERELAIAAELNPRSEAVRGALSEVRERLRRAE
jgi:tetratricopeptide (TPR) repeat protein